MISPHQHFLKQAQKRLKKSRKSGLLQQYMFTVHGRYKMKQYRLSEQKVRSVIAYPDRTEKGIAEKTVAVMKRSGTSKHQQEIWVMYQIKRQNRSKYIVDAKRNSIYPGQNKNQLSIISAWRYPGTSPERDPIPDEIWDEINSLL